jgi:hypothetical protein
VASVCYEQRSGVSRTVRRYDLTSLRRVYDLEKWRQHDYEEQLFKWSILNSETKLYELGSQVGFPYLFLTVPDFQRQPPFNLVFYKNYKILDSRFNTMDLAGLKDSDGHVWTVTPERMRKAVVIQYARKCAFSLVADSCPAGTARSRSGPSEPGNTSESDTILQPWNCEHGNYAELWHSYLPNFRQYRTIGEQKELDTVRCPFFSASFRF